MTDKSQLHTAQNNCPECHAGLMHLEHITYFTWLTGELITVPDFPAWVCDVCGRREYDAQAVSWLNVLLYSGRSHPTHPVKQRKEPPDQPSARF